METQTVLFEVAKPPPSGVYVSIVTVHSVCMCVWCDHTCTAKIIGLKKKLLCYSDAQSRNCSQKLLLHWHESCMNKTLHDCIGQKCCSCHQYCNMDMKAAWL